ncbi:MAG: nucleoside monophosphate kinase, partial [Acidobacteria bacterium]|nr:nucleoside monophosphate kinase [Acidobacteriota bacterium]
SLKFPHISTGDMLREALKNETELGKKAKGYMESGALVPDELVDAIVAERLRRDDCGEGLILDGYPRTISQAEALQSIFEQDGSRVLTIGVEVGDSVLIGRLSSRWTCPACGKMFNANLDPSKAGGACDACGAGLVQRKDDTKEVIAERLEVYHKATRPLIRYYRDRDLYFGVDGDQPIGTICESIMNRIKRDA